MSQAVATRHTLRALAKWPRDRLRPEQQFPDVLRRRIEASSAAGKEQAQLDDANALYSLLENRYTKKYPVSPFFMKPGSNPDYYTNLVQELEAAPTRSKWNAFTKRMWNIVGWS